MGQWCECFSVYVRNGTWTFNHEDTKMNFIKRNIKAFFRACAFFKMGWTNYDWDYAYIYELLEFKLKRMEKVIGNGWGANSHRLVKQMKYTRYLLNRIVEHNYYDKYEAPLVEKYGKRHIEFLKTDDSRYTQMLIVYSKIDKTDEKKLEEANDAYLGIYKQSEMDRSADVERCFKFIGRQHRHWWD
jgi:hypothetical protein